MTELKPPRADPPIFHARIPVNRHLSKKNGRDIKINRRTGQRFIGKSNDLTSAETHLILELLQAKSSCRAMMPIANDIHACFRFYFSDYHTAKGVRRRNMPDLSNLLELPQDCLESAGVILNDTQIQCLDGSGRFPSNENVLEIYLWLV